MHGGGGGQEARGEPPNALRAGGRRGGVHTHILHEKGASGIKHELVGVKHVPAVRLKLDVTQVWVIDHGSEVGQQQTEGELEGGEQTRLTASSPTSGVPRAPVRRAPTRVPPFVALRLSAVQTSTRLASFSDSPLH